MKKFRCLLILLVIVALTTACGKKDSEKSKQAEQKDSSEDSSASALSFELAENQESYYVVGAGSFEGSTLIIPDTHLNLPVTKIKSYAFSFCEKLTSVTIGKNIVDIEYRAFYNCDNISEVIFNAVNCNDCTTSPFGDLGKNTPDGASIKIGKDVERIPAFMFGHGKYEIKIMSVGSLTFEPGSKCVEIGKSAFGHSLNMDTLTLPEGLETIGEEAFYGSEKLLQVTLPTSLKTIEYAAFGFSPKLVEIYNFSSINLELGVKENGEIAYYALMIHTTASANSILVNQENFVFIAKDGKNYLLAYVGNDVNITLPANYKNAPYGIYEYAFYASKIESVTIPECVNEIGCYAFDACYQLKYANFADPNGWKYQPYNKTYELDPKSLSDAVTAAEMLGGGSMNLSSYDDEVWFKE